MLNNQTVNTIDKEQTPFFYELPKIAKKGNIIRTSERDIKVLLKIDKPYILYLDNVLSYDECNQLIELSKNRLEPSQIIDTYSGERKLAPGRTSKGAYYKVNENNFISKIENRIAEITNHPIINGEGLQVLNYELGEEYKAHFDYFPSGQIQLENGGQRIATFLMYLNDVEEGGETIFPKIGLSIVPKKGTALYFHYGNNKGQVDRLSLHSSVPVTKGEKWVSTKWIREGMIIQ
ncbi:2OG-Fe(II) oxygenase [Cytobacillus citreus]|uniref:2OG-Fe(II) oxygenase n=1 Tax=Cytobacillus citreus TaxID=2833586 RepID=UPI003B832FF8